MLSKEIEKKALGLRALDKIHLVEIILESLEKSNPEIEKKWIEESEKRYEAYKEGKLKGVPLDEIKAKFEK